MPSSCPPARPTVMFNTPPRSWTPDLIMGLTLIIIIVLLTWPSPLVHLDVAARDAIEADRPVWALEVAKVFKFLGLPTIQALVITYVGMWCAVWHRSVRPLLPIGAAWLLLAGTKELQPLSDRVFPHWPDCPPVCPDTNVGADGAAFFAGWGYDAFPSGHSTATAIWVPLAIWLIPRIRGPWRWLLAAAPSVLLTAGQTYLGYHWVTDNAGGILLGALILRFIQRIDWQNIPLGPLARLDRWIGFRTPRHGSRKSFSSV